MNSGQCTYKKRPAPLAAKRREHAGIPYQKCFAGVPRCGDTLSRVPTGTGLYLQANPARRCRVSVQERARATGQADVQAKFAVHDPAKHSYGPDQVALTSPVRAD